LVPNFLAEDEMSNNALEFMEGISCNFHKQIEAMRHCSLSYVQRWSFLIMDECCGPLAIEFIPGKHCDFSTYLTKRATAVYLSSRFPCWNPKNKYQGTTLMQNKPMQQVRAEGDVRPWWLRPLRPLRRPREPIEVNLMCDILKQKGRTVGRSGTMSQSHQPLMQSLYSIGPRRMVVTSQQEYILY
jgi:hypothetical protein